MCRAAPPLPWQAAAHHQWSQHSCLDAAIAPKQLQDLRAGEQQALEDFDEQESSLILSKAAAVKAILPIMTDKRNRAALSESITSSAPFDEDDELVSHLLDGDEQAFDDEDELISNLIALDE